MIVCLAGIVKKYAKLRGSISLQSCACFSLKRMPDLQRGKRNQRVDWFRTRIEASSIGGMLKMKMKAWPKMKCRENFVCILKAQPLYNLLLNSCNCSLPRSPSNYNAASRKLNLRGDLLLYGVPIHLVLYLWFRSPFSTFTGPIRTTFLFVRLLNS